MLVRAGNGDDMSNQFLQMVRRVLVVITESAPLLASRMGPFLVECINNESGVVRSAALELAAGVGRFMEAPRLNQAACDEVTSSVAVLAEILLESPQKLFIFIIKKIICWLKVSQNKIVKF